MELLPPKTLHDNPDVDDEFDRLAEQGVISYDDARRHRNPELYRLEDSSVPIDVKSRGATDVATAEQFSPSSLPYGEGKNIGPDGQIEYFNPPIVLSQEQQKINELGSARVRTALAKIAARKK